MANEIKIGGRLHSVASGNVLAGADEIIDDELHKKQSVINAEVQASLATIPQTASAEITENDPTAAPEAHAEIEDGEIKITLKNIKGEKGDKMKFNDLSSEEKESLRGPQGDSVIVGEGDLPMAHVLGNDNQKAMSQKGVSDEILPLKRAINGEDTNFTYISSGAAAGKMMHPNSPSISSNLVTPASGTGQISDAKFIRQGEKVRVITYCDTSKQFAAIAKFSSPTATGGTKLEGMGIIASDPPVLNTTVWTADADCYVRVSGIVEGMTAAIIPANPVAKKEELESAQSELSAMVSETGENLQSQIDGNKASIEDIQAELIGDLPIECNNVGVLHPNSGAITLPDANHTGRGYYRYSDLVTCQKGDEIYVRTYRNKTGTATYIVSNGDKKASTQVDDTQNEYLEKTYTVEEDGEEIRVCGYVGENEEYELTTIIHKAKSIARKSDLDAVNVSVQQMQAQVEEIANGSSTLPDYWKEHIQTKLDEVATEKGGDSFIFITDVHYSQNFGMSTDVIANIVKDYPFAKVIVGGDICSTGFDMKNDSAGAYTNYDQMMTREIKAFEQLFDKAGKYARVYTARGNHDYSEHNQVSKTKHWASEAVKHMRGLIDGIGVYDNAANSPDSLYYYFDNREAKIRYIIVDCVDGRDDGSLVIYNTQMQRVAATLNELEEGWKAVIVGHCPITTYFAVSYETGRDKFLNFRNMLLAYNKKQSTEIGGISYNFTAAVGEIILYIHGHTHVDNQAFHDGIPFVATMCDKYNHHAWSPFAEGTDLAESPKTKGTAKEQAFDAVTIDADKAVISCRRIGLGHDRHFHIGEIEVQAGSTVPLEASIITPSLWKACDEDVMNNNAATDAKGSGDYDMPVKNVFATIDSNGVVTANAQGDVLVFAEDEDHNREFFHIKVIG